MLVSERGCARHAIAQPPPESSPDGACWGRRREGVHLDSQGFATELRRYYLLTSPWRSPSRYSPPMSADRSIADQAWLERQERLWRRAHAIVRERPELDVSGVYHVLCNLERSPEERLRKGLLRGRLSADGR